MFPLKLFPLVLACIANSLTATEPLPMDIDSLYREPSLVGTKPGHRTLGLPQNYKVSEVDSGCCGMAGSFGFEAEHYELSMRIGELVLFPAVRGVPDQDIIAASGTSCRQQILDGTGRRALHPAEILHDALVPEPAP